MNGFRSPIPTDFTRYLSGSPSASNQNKLSEIPTLTIAFTFSSQDLNGSILFKNSFTAIEESCISIPL